MEWIGINPTKWKNIKKMYLVYDLSKIKKIKKIIKIITSHQLSISNLRSNLTILSIV